MNSSTENRTALIIGCGVAGPVLGMFLQRIGIVPEIYEGRSAPRDHEGFFLNLGENGMDVLDTLGIGERIRNAGYRTERLVFQNHQGKDLGENANSTLLIKRGQLTRILREEAIDREIPVMFGKRLTDVELPHEEMVIAHFDDKTEAHGDILVGCDGIHSRTRQSALLEASAPEYTGIVDSGAFTHTSAVPPSGGEMRMTFGVDGFFGYQKVPSDEIFWFENHEQATEPDRSALKSISTEEWKDHLLDVHRRDHETVNEIIESTEGEIGRWPIYDLPSLPRWHRNNVCLIGDAAHATSPHAGQGASLAMEDAIVLAKHLRDIGATPEAFEAFEDSRRERVEEIVEISRETGNHKAPTNVITRKVRDILLPYFLKRGADRFEQIYTYRIEWETPVEDESST